MTFGKGELIFPNKLKAFWEVKMNSSRKIFELDEESSVY
jgi:hypothetical protein